MLLGCYTDVGYLKKRARAKSAIISHKNFKYPWLRLPGGSCPLSSGCKIALWAALTSNAGTRLVPIHPSISDLVDKLVATSRDNFLIFSKSKNQYDERSTGLSRRFGRLKSSLGYGPELVFHSLRKTVTTKLEQAGVPEGIAADIVGHEKQTITYGLYSGGTSMAQKMEAITKISY